MMKFKIPPIFVELILVAAIGGVLSLVLSMLLATALANIILQFVVFVGLIISAVMLKKTADFDDKHWFDAFLYFVSLLAVGGAVILIYPPASKFLLSTGDMTVLGAMFTLNYILLAQTIKGMLVK